MNSVHAKIGEFKRAIEAFNKSAELDSKIASPWNNFSMVYALRGEFDKTINAFGYNPKLLLYFEKLTIYIQIKGKIRVEDSHRNESFQDKLNRFVRDVFRNELLVLVDEIKGYKPIKQIEKIKCNRITSGAPRCKYYEENE